jgi:predicted ester cyclase
MSIKENKEFIRRFYAVIEKEFEQAKSGKDEWHSPEFIYHGPRGTLNYKDYMQLMDKVAASFPDFKFTVDDIIAEGDKVVARFSVSGTHKGPFMGVAPTGRKVKWDGINIYRVSGGKIVESWAINDNLGVMQQIGAIPAPK